MKTPCLPKISLFFILFVVTFSGYAQMRRIYLDGSGMNNNLRKISMINAAEGYFAFDLGAGFSGDSGRSITYRDVYPTGNVDFNGYSVNLTGGFQISGVHAFSRDTFLLYGDFGQNPAILYSNNFGGSYTLIYQSQANTSHLTYGIQDMVFPLNTNTGYAVEADRIIKSTDRGKTWVAVYSSTGSFFDFIEAIDDNTIFAFNSDGWTNKMVVTSDGGAHWRNVNLPTSQKINYASFISATKGWLSASENQSLYYTSDGGITWTLKNNTSVLPFFCTKMKFINDSTGYATADQYTVLKTTDSGKIWETLPRDNSFSYLNNTHTELAFLNNNQFWAGGGQGFIEMSTNGGGITLPRALFSVDTTGLSVTGKVNLTNLGKNGYQYAWYKNDSLLSATFNSSYVHGTYDAFDTIKLVVTKGSLKDSSIIPLYFIVPLKPKPATFNYFLPDSGSTGTTVSLVGSNFAGVTSVLFGGVPASSFAIVNDTLIKAVVAGGASGSVSIVTPVSTVTQNGFIYFTPLRITSFSPASGPVGTIITIQGNQFGSNPTDNIVFIGGIRVPVLSSTPTTITVRAPGGAFYHEISVTVGGLTAVSNIPFIVSYPGGAPVTKNSFPARITFPYNYSDPHIASADLDGDGKLDLILGHCVAFNWLSIMKNNSVQDSVSFVQVPTSSRPVGAGIDGSVTVADLDGDGKLDIIGGANFNGEGGELGIYRNTSSPGTIRFAPVIDLASYTNTQILVCDLDGDGKPEIIGSGDGGFTIYQNTSHDSTISFVHYTGPNIPSLTGLAAYSDVDGDGKMDILISTTSGIEVYRNISNKGSIQFERYPTLSVLSTGFTGWPVFKIGDFDGDGRSDVLVLTDDTTATVMLNTSTTGNISFGLPYKVSAPNSVRGFGIGDLNGDGKADLGLASKKGFAFQNSSQPTNLNFASGIDLMVDSVKDVAIDMAHIDVNGDGKTDIVTMNSGPGYANTISVFLNQNPDAVSICAGTDTILTSSLAGLNYQWQFKKDTSFIIIPEGGHFTGTTTNILQLKNMDSSYNGIIFSCLTDGAPGKSTMLLVNTPVMPSVTITSAGTFFCPGSTASFTATALHTGANPVYQWQINGHNIGSNNMILTTDSLRDQDTISLILKPNLACAATDSVLSNYIVIHVGIPQTPSVTIQSSDSVICSGTTVRFTAASINPGTSPSYQWQVNGMNAGTDSSIFITSNLYNGSNVSVLLKSSVTCSTLPSVSSNSISVQVNSVFTPSVQLTQITAGNICAGAPVQFSTSAQTGNGKPDYQWIKNGSPVGTDSAAYQDPSVRMNDQFYVVYYPHDICSLADSVVSNTITVITQQPPSPTVFISGTTSLDSGTISSIMAAVTNAGSSPVYQWQDSTQANDWQDLAGETETTLQFKPVNSGDKIRCRYSSMDICNTYSNTESNVLEFSLKVPADTTTIPTIPIDSNATDLRCYPNPVHSTLTVTGMKLIDQWQTLTIVNSNGQQVRTIDVRGQTTLYVPVDGLSNGLYFILMKTAGSKTAKLKFLKG